MRLGIRKVSLPSLVALLGTIALLAAGCGSTTPKGPANLAKDQTLTIPINMTGSADFSSLDPDLCPDTTCAQQDQFIFGGGMFAEDANLNGEKWDAKSYDVSSDGTVYTIHLKDNLRYSNGDPVNAADYAYSINRSANPCVASPQSSYVASIKDAATFSAETCTNGVITAADGQTSPVIQTLIGTSLVAVDAKTLKITLQAPAAYFTQEMTFPNYYPIQQKLVGSDITSEKWLDQLTQGNTGQGGAGPYYVSFWDHSTAIKLKANPNWWGYVKNTHPYIQEIDWPFFAGGDTIYAAYQAGQYDYAAISPATLVEPARGDADFHEQTQLVETYLGINNLVAPFNNADAREAVCLAINRDQLNTAILKNTVSPLWSAIPKGMPGYLANAHGPDGVTATTGDAAKAKTHWDAYVASLNGAPVPTISLLYNQSTATRKAFWEGVVAQINQALGTNVTTTVTTGTAWVKALEKGTYQFGRLGWAADYPDPQDFLTTMFTTDSSVYAGQGTADTTPSLHAADSEQDAKKREAAYDAAHQKLLDTSAICPLYQNKTQFKIRSHVHGLTQNAETYFGLDSIVNTYITNS
ncbi:MAG TPA: peptide ABC transporter substrate-binding protein [Ktedonobacterales bacterium]|nr:peptide ABC transporter substrate-binding protein [Ktedonobacterales bacterium]